MTIPQVNNKVLSISAIALGIIALYFLVVGFSSRPADVRPDNALAQSGDSVMELRFNNQPDPKNTVITVEKAALCLDVRNRNPVTEMNRFTSDVNNIYCWARLLNGRGQKIRFIWKVGETVAPSAWLDVSNNQFRVWCPKHVDSKASGEGSVDIVDGTGRLLKRLEFQVVNLKKSAKRNIRRA
jgi:hypothetical protein